MTRKKIHQPVLGPDMIRLLVRTQRTSAGPTLAPDCVVVDAVWQSFSAYLPKRPVSDHPVGCHRPRISDRDCFEAILFRMVTGCSWGMAGRVGKASETTLRRRRDEWVSAGAFGCGGRLEVRRNRAG